MRYEGWWKSLAGSWVVTNLALSISETAVGAIARPASHLSLASSPCVKSEKSITREIVVIGLIMCTLQVLDGVLTGIGVARHGIAAEGNLIIRVLMEAWGPTLALVAVKSLALAIVAVLCVLAFKISWITRTLRVIAVIYLGAAILPWSLILLTRLL
jgi:hypothetical protein